MYKLYGDFEANPSKRWNCQIGGEYTSLSKVIEDAKITGYSYVEIRGPNGLVDIEAREQKSVNFLLFGG